MWLEMIRDDSYMSIMAMVNQLNMNCHGHQGLTKFVGSQKERLGIGPNHIMNRSLTMMDRGALYS